ncbi:MAG TPA: Flp1 family type IVb pilin [Clostridia bacterium]|nr:Flp1 family type IVb pilin [Clostridia bacterium]
MNEFKRFVCEEEAMGTLEVILISAVLIGAAILFKEKIMDIVNTMTADLTDSATDAID